MKIEIDKNGVNPETDSFTKEVKVQGTPLSRGQIPATETTSFNESVSNLEIIEGYISSNDVSRILITYKPEAQETINGVDVFYDSDLDFEGQLDFTVYGEDDDELQFVDFGYVDNKALLDVLTTIEGAVRIVIE